MGEALHAGEQSLKSLSPHARGLEVLKHRVGALYLIECQLALGCQPESAIFIALHQIARAHEIQIAIELLIAQAVMGHNGALVERPASAGRQNIE